MLFFAVWFPEAIWLSRHGERIGDYCAIGVYEGDKIDEIGEKKTIALGVAAKHMNEFEVVCIQADRSSECVGTVWRLQKYMCSVCFGYFVSGRTLKRNTSVMYFVPLSHKVGINLRQLRGQYRPVELARDRPDRVPEE